jgi:hypothetical protein
MRRLAWLLLLLAPAAFAQIGGGGPPGYNVPPYAPSGAPSNGQCLVWSSSANAYVNSSCGFGSGITALTGVVTGTGPGSTATSFGASATTSLPAGNLPLGVLSNGGSVIDGVSDAATLTNKDGTSPTNKFNIGNAINVTGVTYGVSAAASDNATALQAAINAAISAKVPLYIPSAGSGCYKYTAPLTINGNLTIIGDYIAGNWAGGINVPIGSPVLVGSVLCPTSNGSDAIDITGSSYAVNIENLGILFQTAFSGTGDGINYTPASTQGLSGSVWKHVEVYGQDGNHYAYNLANFIYDTFIEVNSYGGGGFKLYGGGATGQFGNATFVEPYVNLLTGGTSHGYSISSLNSSQKLNLLLFLRPQANVNNTNGLSSGNLPTSAQNAWYMDTNSTSIDVKCADWETNISGVISVVNTSAASSNNLDIPCANVSAAISSPAWTTSGIVTPTRGTMTFTDTTSTGTVPVIAINAVQNAFTAATNAITATNLATLYVPSPGSTTNITVGENDAIYTPGNIRSTGQISGGTASFSAGGSFFGGYTNITQIHQQPGALSAASWGIGGLLTSGTTSTLTDTTASGSAVSLEAINELQAYTLATTNSATIANVATLVVAPPLQGANLIASELDSIYATGIIRTAGQLAGPTFFATPGGGGSWYGGAITLQGGGGAIKINSSFNSATQIGDGTTSSTVTVGSTNNTTILGSTTLNLTGIAATSAGQTGTVCIGTGSTLTYDTTTTCLLSARRFKMREEPLDEGLDAVLRLKPVSYYFRPKVNGKKFAHDANLTGQQVGFIAEDVNEVDPRLVTVQKDGQLHSVRYEQMTALLAKGLQEFHAQFEDEKSTVSKISGRVDANAVALLNDAQLIHSQQLEIYALALWALLLSGGLAYALLRRRQ